MENKNTWVCFICVYSAAICFFERSRRVVQRSASSVKKISWPPVHSLANFFQLHKPANGHG
jgi:hypothetical protein